MNKFQKLAQLNRDIELLENAGKIKSAEILQKKFLKEAQQYYPRTRKDRAPDLAPGFNTDIKIREEVLDYAQDIWTVGAKSVIPKMFFNSKESDFLDKVKQGQIDPRSLDINTVQDYAFKMNNQIEAFPQNRKKQPQMGNMQLATTPVSNIGPNPDPRDDVPTSPQSTHLGDGLTVNKGNIIYPEDTAKQNAKELSAEEMKKRIQYYEGKINEYHNLKNNPKYKEKMLLYLTTYIDNNYDQGKLDPNSYSRLMNALGEKSGIS